MNLRQALHQVESLFISHHIEDAHLEAELLLMHALGVDRAELYTKLEQPLLDTEGFWHLVERRLHHEPTPYILRQREFYGIDFHVDPRVLIPRPESELLVEKAVEFVSQHFPSPSPCLIADVGTGSGVIAISLALHLPEVEIYAVDISAAALEVASMNCHKHQVASRIHLLLGDMLQPLPRSVDLIVANLPYVRDAAMHQLSLEIQRFEPKVALAGGVDGLSKVRQLLSQARERLHPAGLILLEIGESQGQVVAREARSHFPDAKIDLIPDLAGIERVIRIAT